MNGNDLRKLFDGALSLDKKAQSKPRKTRYKKNQPLDEIVSGIFFNLKLGCQNEKVCQAAKSIFEKTKKDLIQITVSGDWQFCIEKNRHVSNGFLPGSDYYEPVLKYKGLTIRINHFRECDDGKLKEIIKLLAPYQKDNILIKGIKKAKKI
ncbi:MAG: hypothetical protein WCW02_04990 [Candidatus Buchananbacteria bacterium]